MKLIIRILVTQGVAVVLNVVFHWIHDVTGCDLFILGSIAGILLYPIVQHYLLQQKPRK